MQTIKLQGHVGPDGILKLEVPVAMLNTDVEVVVVVQQFPPAVRPVQADSKPTPEELGWPPGFFEQTYGSLADDPIEIDSEGDYEVREPIA